jgi:hypothetical protein
MYFTLVLIKYHLNEASEQFGHNTSNFLRSSRINPWELEPGRLNSPVIASIFPNMVHRQNASALYSTVGGVDFEKNFISKL